ncbi:MULTISPECIES: transposase [unclassified Sedimentibacter]|uniref:transposase n=1 Tax=unclassified Sedimentibacter TaxID=2649220 RepID=UPI0027E0A3D7|nr:transposase [Sedimentibacter sp. MB35-C1]WMJ77556.1 transposase [Sedimentibacter sp. MB35-C1]
MPRSARLKSESGIYHVMLRGIDKRNIFLKPGDYEKFIESMIKAKEKVKFFVYAYCLMTNHVHILIKRDTEDIGDTVRRIAVSYAQYHNNMYGRTGHLFQNRFLSEVVDNGQYFLTVIRYIHQNPLKAGIIKDINDYKWSSYNEYINDNEFIVDSEFALSYFKSIEEFINYHNETNEDVCLDYDEKKRWTDEELKKFILTYQNISCLQALDKKTRDTIIKKIKEDTGASNRQLARVLNIGRGILDTIK